MNKEYQKMNKIEPYNDANLTYDENTKRYFLTLETVKSNLPETITDDGILTYRIKKNTRIVYNYILSHCHSSNRKVVVDLIAHTEEYRNWIYEVLMAQMEDDLFKSYSATIGKYSKSFKLKGLPEYDLVKLYILAADMSTVLLRQQSIGSR